MTLKRRLDKLEPAASEAWVKAWEEALIPPEISHLGYKAERIAETLRSMSQEESEALDQRFFADHDNYPALKEWNDLSFAKWREIFFKWFDASGHDFQNPNLSLWPHHAPKPPDIPEAAFNDLKRGASKWDELADLYAFWLLEVGMAVGISQAIAKHEARAGPDGETSKWQTSA